MPDNEWDHIAPMASGEVMLHIGPPKTGSTAIQTVMAGRRAELVELGVLYPGSEPRAKFPSWAVMGEWPRGKREPMMAEWDELVSEINKSGLKAVVSSEALIRADAGAVTRIVRSFGAERVHVVAVGRRLDRALPSLYQQKVKKFHAKTYEEWLGSILVDDDLDALLASFPPGQQLAETVGKWSTHLPPHRIHLICSEEGNRQLLPRSIEKLLDVPEGFLEPVAGVNDSLDRTSVEMLRQLNVMKKSSTWTDEFYRKMIFQGAAAALGGREWGSDDTKVPIPPEWALNRLRTLADHTITSLRAYGPHVIGNLDRLRPGEDVVASSSPLRESPTIAMDVAVTALAGAVEAAWRREQAWRPSETSGEGGVGN